jgi:hypothetical protein
LIPSNDALTYSSIVHTFSFRYVPGSLLLLPSRKVYLARIARLAAANDNKEESARLETVSVLEDTFIGGEDNINGTDADAAGLKAAEDADTDDTEKLVYRATIKLTGTDAQRMPNE